jgi:CSLREA domain-containing protein
MLLQKPIASGIKARVSLALLLAALLAVAALSVGAPSVAQAATITVDSTTNTVADDGLCTLREAITAANTDTASGATAGGMSCRQRGRYHRTRRRPHLHP